MNKAGICSAALMASRGRVIPAPTGEGELEKVIAALEEMAGIKLLEPAADIVKAANRFDGGKITFLTVNTADGDIHISFILSFEDEPAETEADLLRRGYVLAYVYNVCYPHCSEAGSILLEKSADGKYIHRIG